MPTEEERAIEYRRMAQAREDNRAELERSMAGDPEALRQLEANWDALRPWKGWEPIRKVKGDPK